MPVSSRHEDEVAQNRFVQTFGIWRDMLQEHSVEELLHLLHAIESTCAESELDEVKNIHDNCQSTNLQKRESSL